MPQLLDDIVWHDQGLVKPYLHPDKESGIKEELGYVPEILYYVGYYDWMVDIWYNMFKFFTYHTGQSLSKKQIELIAFVEAQESSCRHCYGLSRTKLKLLGFDEQVIRKIERDNLSDELPEKEVQVLKLVRQICRLNPRPDLKTLLNDGNTVLNQEELEELLMLSSFCNMCEFLTVGLAIQPEQRMEAMSNNKAGRWIIRIMNKWMTRKLIPELTLSEKPLQADYPFSGLIQSYSKNLSGITIIMSNWVWHTWQAGELSRQTKLIMWLIIARLAEADDLIEELSDWLKNEGVTSSEIRKILDHLEYDRLNEVENKTLELARKSIRKKSDEFQQWSNDFLQLGNEKQLILALSTAAAGNFAARISLLR